MLEQQQGVIVRCEMEERCQKLALRIEEFINLGHDREAVIQSLKRRCNGMQDGNVPRTFFYINNLVKNSNTKIENFVDSLDIQSRAQLIVVIDLFNSYSHSKPK